MRYFLGMEVAQSKKGLVISQRKYTFDSLKDTRMIAYKLVGTPLEKGWKFEENGDDAPVDKERYQRLVRRLIYLSLTRPDIAYSVSVINQYMHSPTEKHMKAIQHVLRYLKGTPRKELMFKRSENRGIEGYVDADWTGSREDS